MYKLALGVLVFLTLACPATAKDRLHTVKTWMYQLQDLYEPGAWAALARTGYDMLVIEPGHNFAQWPYDTATMLRVLRRKPDGGNRVLLAYIDIAEAEDYRDYWGPDWVAPRGNRPGTPDFLISEDPDGWAGNYPVAYWEPAWQHLWLGQTGIVADLARLGFDGIYLDWVEAYDDDAVRAAARVARVSPEAEMIRFVERLGAAGRAVDRRFLVVAQNAPYLLDAAPIRYAAAIDGLAVEDTWFHGQGDRDWNDPRGGDRRDRHDGAYETAARLAQIAKFRARGLPVFSVDYAMKPANVALVYHEAPRHGLVPLVTRVALSRLTGTPPPWLDSDR